MARKPRGRPVTGILLLDKAPGRSSNHALQAVKRLFEARKAGHTGSLDPLASGLLPLCFGEATKVSAFLLEADKTYWVRACLGVKTATGDAEGEVVARQQGNQPDADQLRTAMTGFVGEQMQIPPMYSAVKHQGRRLYELAREGVEVERAPRPIRIDEFSLLDADSDAMDLRVRCSKGTYVRTLVEDLAESLGSLAHVTELRRTRVGPFPGESMVTYETLRETSESGGRDALDRLLLPMGDALHEWPAVTLDADTAFYLGRGQPVQVPNAPVNGWVRLCTPDERMAAVGEVLEDGRIAPRRVFQH